MILVDSSVWMDHLNRSDAKLSALLGDSAVLCHPFVMGEIACGSLPNRHQVLQGLGALPRAPVASHDEALGLLERFALSGTGVGWIDIHLLASALLAGRAPLFTRDKRLRAAAAKLGLSMPGNRH